MVWQFAYVYEVSEILLFSEKKYKMQPYNFLSQKQHKTLISKITVILYILRTWFTINSLLIKASTPWTNSQKISH